MSSAEEPFFPNELRTNGFGFLRIQCYPLFRGLPAWPVWALGAPSSAPDSSPASLSCGPPLSFSCLSQPDLGTYGDAGKMPRKSLMNSQKKAQ